MSCSPPGKPTSNAAFLSPQSPLFFLTPTPLCISILLSFLTLSLLPLFPSYPIRLLTPSFPTPGQMRHLLINRLQPETGFGFWVYRTHTCLLTATRYLFLCLRIKNTLIYPSESSTAVRCCSLIDRRTLTI